MKRIRTKFLLLIFVMNGLFGLAQCDQFTEQLLPTPSNFNECGSFEMTYSRVGWSPYIYYGGLKPETIRIETSDNITLVPSGCNPGWIWNDNGWSFDGNNDNIAGNDPGDMNDSCTWHFKFIVHIAPCAFDQECSVQVIPNSDGNTGPEEFGQTLQWQAMPIAAGIRETHGDVKPVYTEYYDLRGSKVENSDASTGIIVKRVTYSDGSQKSQLNQVVNGKP